MWIEQDSKFLNAQFERFNLKQQYWHCLADENSMERACGKILDSDVIEVIKFQST